MRGESVSHQEEAVGIFENWDFWIAIGISQRLSDRGHLTVKWHFVFLTWERLHEKKKKPTINPFLKHRLKKQGAGAKPRWSFMISSLKENKQGTFRFQIILPPKPLSSLLLWAISFFTHGRKLLWAKYHWKSLLSHPFTPGEKWSWMNFECPAEEMNDLWLI